MRELLTEASQRAIRWQGQTAMRISVSCWATAAEDVRRSLEAILRIAAAEGGK